jgi:hypothetical protein
VAGASARYERHRRGHFDVSATWITVLKNDKRAIFGAAAPAQRAADYFHSLQPKETEEKARPASASRRRRGLAPHALGHHDISEQPRILRPAVSAMKKPA